MTEIADPALGSAPATPQHGLRVRHGLDARARAGDRAARRGRDGVPRRERRSTRPASTSRPARRSSTARRRRRGRPRGAGRQAPDAGVGARPATRSTRYAMTQPKIGLYTGGATEPNNPIRPAAGSTYPGHCGVHAAATRRYCQALFTLTQKIGLPAVDGPADHDDRPRGRRARDRRLHRADQPELRRSPPGAGATALQAFVNARRPLRRPARGRHDVRAQRRADDAEHAPRSPGLSTPGSFFAADVRHGQPGRVGLRQRRLHLPRDDAATRSTTRRRWRQRRRDRRRRRRRQLRRPAEELRLRAERARRRAAPGPAGGGRPAVRRRARDHARVRLVLPRVAGERRAAVLNAVLYPDGASCSPPVRRAPPPRPAPRRAARDGADAAGGAQAHARGGRPHRARRADQASPARTPRSCGARSRRRSCRSGSSARSAGSGPAGRSRSSSSARGRRPTSTSAACGSGGSRASSEAEGEDPARAVLSLSSGAAAVVRRRRGRVLVVPHLLVVWTTRSTPSPARCATGSSTVRARRRAVTIPAARIAALVEREAGVLDPADARRARGAGGGAGGRARAAGAAAARSGGRRGDGLRDRARVGGAAAGGSSRRRRGSAARRSCGTRSSGSSRRSGGGRTRPSRWPTRDCRTARASTSCSRRSRSTGRC